MIWRNFQKSSECSPIAVLQANDSAESFAYRMTLWWHLLFFGYFIKNPGIYVFAEEILKVAENTGAPGLAGNDSAGAMQFCEHSAGRSSSV